MNTDPLPAPPPLMFLASQPAPRAPPSGEEPEAPDSELPSTRRPPRFELAVAGPAQARAAAPDVVIIGYVGSGIGVRALPGGGVEITSTGGGIGEGVRFVGQDRPGEAVADMVAAAGQIVARGAPEALPEGLLRP